jgi:hypothetical protein
MHDVEPSGMTCYLHDPEFHKRCADFTKDVPAELFLAMKHYLEANNPHVSILDNFRGQMTVTMPTDCAAGDTFSVSTPLGNRISVTVPEGCVAGEQFEVPAFDQELQVVLQHKVGTTELAHYTQIGEGKHGDIRDIVFKYKSAESPEFMSCKSMWYETLQFPLIHCEGRPTWDPGLVMAGRPITLALHTRCMHMQDIGDRLKRLDKLTEEFCLDTWCRILEDRSTYWRGKELQTRIANIRSARDAKYLGRNIGTVLPPTIPGSPAYQAELTDEAMAVVVRFGPPTYFITMTCNSKWPEIVAMTEPGHAPSPIVICRVFKQKVEELLERVKKWDGGCMYFFMVVEFQHRGL